jgi:hypothetical protein
MSVFDSFDQADHLRKKRGEMSFLFSKHSSPNAATDKDQAPEGSDP